MRLLERVDSATFEEWIISAAGSIWARHFLCKSSKCASGAASSDARSPQQQTVARALEYIEENYARHLRVDEIAAHVALSPSRLAHLFKAGTGRGPIAYLQEFRIVRACAELWNGARPVGEIAAACGYDDARFFRRAFRRHTGCSPTEYRRQSTAAPGNKAQSV